MAVPDEAGARDKGRSRWEGSARWGSAGHAAILRFGLRPGLDRPGPGPPTGFLTDLPLSCSHIKHRCKRQLALR